MYAIRRNVVEIRSAQRACLPKIVDLKRGGAGGEDVGTRVLGVSGNVEQNADAIVPDLRHDFAGRGKGTCRGKR